MTFRLAHILMGKTGRRRAIVFELELSSYRLREECLTRSPRAVEQNAVPEHSVLIELLRVQVPLG